MSQLTPADRPVVPKRIEALRESMRNQAVDAVIIPSEDPHQSEYPAEHFRLRAYFSGFDGSTGDLVVTADRAALFTDFRYYLAAENALDGTGIELYRSPPPPFAPYIIDYLGDVLTAGQVLGVDGYASSKHVLDSYAEGLLPLGINIKVDFYVGDLWSDRPPMPASELFALPDSVTGESRASKIARLRDSLFPDGRGSHFVSSMEDIAWLLNLRASDVMFNPLFLAFLLIDSTSATLFVEAGRIPSPIVKDLEADGVTLRPYAEAYNAVGMLELDGTSRPLFMDPEKTGVAFYGEVKDPEAVRCRANPTDAFKAIKNEAQTERLREVMEVDGAVMVRFLAWVEANAGSGITEYEAGRTLDDMRRDQETSLGPSFATICGYGANGAIVHYSAPETGSAAIGSTGVLLVDSGGHYLGGTTDITRTLFLGDIDGQAAEDYTLVLQGHISLAKAVFPRGTRGEHLDVLARKPQWDRHITYGHGTGHGVGHVLPVHEGPQRISTRPTRSPMQLGMVTSNEPGLYRPGKWGIRTENLVLTVPVAQSDFGEFFGFETLTLCPIDTRPLVTAMLTAQDRAWINAYHARVRGALMRHVTGGDQDWLVSRTRPI